MTELQERLFAMQDKEYALFQAKLTPGIPMERFIGVRVPLLRAFAKTSALPHGLTTRPSRRLVRVTE